MGVGDGGVTSASARVDTRPWRCLAPQTWSVPDFVRTDLRTLRLAIAKSDRSDRTLYPRKSQAVTPHPQMGVRRTSKLGRTIYRSERPISPRTNNPKAGERGNEQAWREHYSRSWQQ